MRLKALSALVAFAAFSVGLHAAGVASAQETASPAAAPGDSYVERNLTAGTPKRIIYTAARSLGLLRGIQETDLFHRLRFKGSGTLYRPAKTGAWTAVPVSNYYAEISYPQQGLRVDETLAGKREVHVLTGAKAWDEVDLAADGAPVGKSQKDTPDAVTERQLLLAITPYGAIKAAHANLAQVKVTRLPHDIYVLTFPYAGTTMKVTLDRNRRPARVEIPYTHPVLGKTTLVQEYSGYKDYEPITPTSDEAFSFLYFPAHIVRKFGNKVAMDLKVDTCWCTNPYVYFPQANPTKLTVLSDADKAKTPRMPDGHPDLSGMWRRVVADGGVVGRAFIIGRPQDNASGGAETNTQVREGNNNYEEVDAEYIVKSDEDMPAYKPEVWATIHDLEENAYRRPADPQYGCKNQGLVRLGAPAEAFQTASRVAFLYVPGMAIPWYREVSLDGRALPKPDDYQGVLPAGISAGHWEGDTLVVESVDFPSDGGVWYTTRGWVGSAETKVTERYHRVGDRMTYDITIDDPAFYAPWVRPTVTLQVDNKAMLTQPLTCIEYDGGYLPPSQ